MDASECLGVSNVTPLSKKNARKLTFCLSLSSWDSCERVSFYRSGRICHWIELNIIGRRLHTRGHILHWRRKLFSYFCFWQPEAIMFASKYSAGQYSNAGVSTVIIKSQLPSGYYCFKALYDWARPTFLRFRFPVKNIF